MSGSGNVTGFQFGRFELDPQNRVLRSDGVQVSVEPKVLEFLIHLVASRHRLVTHDELRRKLWPGVVVAQASLGRLAKEARRLLGDTGEQQHTICTRRGYGYQFVAETQEFSIAIARPSSAPLEVADEQRSGDTGDTTVVETGQDSLGLYVRWIFPRKLAVRLVRDRPLTIGRDGECDLSLESPSLSRQHAQLLPDGPVWLINDLGSRNGTFVNGIRCNRAPLVPGDVLRLGDWLGIVEAATREDDVPFGTIGHGLHGGQILRRALSAGWQLADARHSINVCGPSGVGKRAVASALHKRSGRVGALVEVRANSSGPLENAAPLVGVDSDALVSRWTEAMRGTLLLHHVSELTASAQERLAQLLRGRAEEPNSPACVSTSLLPLTEYVGRSILIPELYEALHGVELRVPPLNQRVADIPELFSLFLTEHTGGQPPKLTCRAIERLCIYSWPTNVRELRALAREVALTHERAQKLDVDCLPHWVAGSSPATALGGQRDSVT